PSLSSTLLLPNHSSVSPHFPSLSPSLISPLLLFFFFNDTATTEIYTLSLHDALPISPPHGDRARAARARVRPRPARDSAERRVRSEEHTSELQSLTNLVCRLLLEKKKKYNENNS